MDIFATSAFQDFHGIGDVLRFLCIVFDNLTRKHHIIIY